MKKDGVETNPVKAIRLKCLDCSGNSRDEVKNCPLENCPLHPFRSGKNPFKKEKTEKIEIKENLLWK